MRTSLLNRGIRIDAFYTGEVISNVRGGIRQRSTYLDIVEMMITSNFDEIAPWKGTTLYLNVMGTHGKNPGDYVGDLQGISNIAAPDIIKIHEIWLQQNYQNDRFSILFGLYDLNSEFDVLETAGQFLNSSHGMGADYAQSGLNGPSTFPLTSLSLRLKAQLTESISVQSAILDGVPDESDNFLNTTSHLNSQDGALITSEIIYSSDETKPIIREPKRRYFFRQSRRSGEHRRFSGYGKHKNRSPRKYGRQQRKEDSELKMKSQQSYKKFALGGWYYTSKFPQFVASENTSTQYGSWGIYVLYEKSLIKMKNNSRHQLSYFFRSGISDKKVNPVDIYLGSGIVYSDVIRHFQHDQIGVAIAAAHNSEHFKEAALFEGAPLKDWELAFELSYRAELNYWCSVQPDVQYIVNPGFTTDLKNATTFGLRMEICF